METQNTQQLSVRSVGEVVSTWIFRSAKTNYILGGSIYTMWSREKGRVSMPDFHIKPKS
jgi:hypothetical protein